MMIAVNTCQNVYNATTATSVGKQNQLKVTAVESMSQAHHQTVALLSVFYPSRSLYHSVFPKSAL